MEGVLAKKDPRIMAWRYACLVWREGQPSILARAESPRREREENGQLFLVPVQNTGNQHLSLYEELLWEPVLEYHLSIID